MISLRPSKKKQTVRTPKSLDEKYLGTEPEWSDALPTETAIAAAYSWYNYFHGKKELVEMLFKSYPRPIVEVKLLKKLDPNHISSVICYQSRMLSRGCKLPEKNMDFFNSTLDGLLKRAENIRVEQAENRDEPSVSVQDYIKDQVGDYIAAIESEVDSFVSNSFSSEFNMYAWLKTVGVKTQQAKSVASYYRPLLAELNDVKSKKDEQLMEGYSFIKPRELTRYIAFVATIISDASTWGENQKTVRKTRVKKPLSVEKQISHVLFMTDFTELKLVSINPTAILGARQLWVYNTKQRMLTCYDAADVLGFSVKGTTLQNVANTSCAKRLRKPADILPKVSGGGKRVLENLLDGINSKAQTPNGRLNRDTILMRVIK